MAKRMNKAERCAAVLEAQAEKWQTEARVDRERGRMSYAKLNEDRARDAMRDAAALRSTRQNDHRHGAAMTAPDARGATPPDASPDRVFDALQALAVRHGSMAAAARVVGVSKQAVHRILAKGKGVAPDLAQRILSAAGDVPAVERAPLHEHTRIERAAEERRAAADARRYEARPATDAPVSSASPMDTLAAVVATLLVRSTVDPIAEIDPKRPGCFAHRVERHVLSLLLERYGNWNQVALATRGRPIGSTIQRNIDRHAYPHEPMSPELAREVQELLGDAPLAWAALLDAFGDGDGRAAE